MLILHDVFDHGSTKGLLTTTVRNPSSCKCIFCFLFVFSWRRLGRWLFADYTDENSGRVRENQEAPRKHLGACGFSLGQVPIKHHRNYSPHTLFFVQFSIKFDLGRRSGGSLGPPWDAFGSRPRKTTKRPLFGVPFLCTFLTYCRTFLMLVF
jgi:hypothetical protein